jgi:hypothetical protein
MKKRQSMGVAVSIIQSHEKNFPFGFETNIGLTSLGRYKLCTKKKSKTRKIYFFKF